MSARGHAAPEAAAKRWGNEQGIVNVGGTLYWDVAPTSGHPARRKPFNLGVGRETGRGPLVTGYGHSGTNKGWLALSTVLRHRGALIERDGRWFVVDAPEAV